MLVAREQPFLPARSVAPDGETPNGAHAQWRRGGSKLVAIDTATLVLATSDAPDDCVVWIPAWRGRRIYSEGPAPDDLQAGLIGVWRRLPVPVRTHRMVQASTC